MKKSKIFSIMLLFLTSIFTLLPSQTTVSAQEQILVDVNVFLLGSGGEPIEQSQISYDIIQPNPEGGDGTVVYSYRSDSPPAGALSLAPGNYRFRLFDGGNFYRDGQAVQPYSFRQTIATLTEDDIANNLQKRPLDPGQINEWGDGTRVYDVAFSLATGDNIYNPATGAYEVDLDFTLGDASAIAAAEGSELPPEESQPDEDTQSSSLSIYVTDEFGSPFANVLVTVNGTEYYTDDLGIFVLENLTIGEQIQVSVTAPEGYNGGRTTNPFIVEANNLYEMSVTLTEDEVTPEPTTTSLTLTVNGPSQEPVANVGIEVNEQILYTNELGQVVFENMAAGQVTYYLIELPVGYLASTMSGQVAVDGNNPAQANIALDTEVTEGSIQFTVTDQEGSAVADVEIIINDQAIYTNESGNATIENLPSGGYSYQISAPSGFQTPAEGTLNVDAGENYTENIVLVKEQQYGTVNIQVVDENSTPIPGSEIMLDDSVYATNSEGAAIIEGVSVGTHTYALSSLPAGYETDDEPAEQTIEVQADQVTEGLIQITQAQDQGNAEFTVKNEDGQALSAVTVTINEQTATTNEEGRAVIENLPTGDYAYQLSGLSEDYQTPAEAYLNIQTDSTTTIEITIENVIEYGNVDIRVVDENDNPIPASEIMLDETVYPTNSQGAAIIEGVRVGTHTYSLSRLPEGYEVDEMPAEQSLEVLANDTAYGTIKVTPATEEGNAEFILTDDQGQGLAGLIVTIGEQAVTTNGEGLALFENLAVGTYTYTISELPEDLTGNVEGQVTVLNDETAQVTVTFQEEITYGGVKFIVQDQDNQVVRATKVTLNGTEYNANEAGEIIIEGLRSGEVLNYTLGQLPEGYTGQESATVTVPENETVEVVISVQRQIQPGQIIITVLDQNSQAVSGAEFTLSNDHRALTDSNGIASFTNLAPATYEYNLTTLPEGYSADIETQSVNLAEGATEERQITVARQIEPGSLIITVLDQEEQPVVGANIALNNQSYTTNESGQVTVSDLEAGAYTYTITELPEDYTGAGSAEVIINEAEETTSTIYVDRMIEPGTASLTVTDQNGEAIEGVVIAFGGLEGATNSNGVVNFTSLELGNYNLSIESVPEGFTNTYDGKQITVTEGAQIEERLTIERLPEIGTVRIAIVDNHSQAVSNVEVEIDGQKVSTNEEGYAAFTDLIAGQSYEYKIVSVPEAYTMEIQTGNITVVADEITTVTLVAQGVAESSSESSEESSSESSSLSTEESSSITSEEQAEIDEEAQQATRQFVHADTGIEVWVNPVDAGNIVRVDVQKLSSLSGLENADADFYQVRLLDKNNEVVQLSRIAEVKVPTRPVTSQLRVVRLNNNVMSNLTFSLHNQRVTFRTQELGNFAIVYRQGTTVSSEESTSESVNVSVESSVQESNNLPATGERSIYAILGLAVALVVAGLGLIFYRKKSAENDEKDE